MTSIVCFFICSIFGWWSGIMTFIDNVLNAPLFWYLTNPYVMITLVLQTACLVYVYCQAPGGEVGLLMLVDILGANWTFFTINVVKSTFQAPSRPLTFLSITLAILLPAIVITSCFFLTGDRKREMMVAVIAMFYIGLFIFLLVLVGKIVHPSEVEFLGDMVVYILV